MFTDLPIWAYVLITLGITHITIASVTIFLHRHQTHRALDLHPAVSHFFRFWLWLTTGIVTQEWVAIHRKHHARVETEEDPHSPKVKGIKKVFWQGAELYRIESADEKTIEKFGRHTPNDWIENNLYKKYDFLGILLMFIIDVSFFGFIGITIWAAQMVWIPFFAAGVINGVGHWWGYRNFESADASTNIIPLGLFIGGEELHNNHHAFTSSARFSTRWYEIDLGWYYIRFMEFLSLAKVRKLAPRLILKQERPVLDLDTMTTIITGRMHVMSNYARDVIAKVCKEEKRNADNDKKKLLRKSKKLLTRHENLLDQKAKKSIEQILAHSPSLEIVYEFRQRLQELWEQQSVSNEKLLQSLQEWCQQAEATGIEALEEFALSLRGYSMARA